METMKFGEPEASQDKASPASGGASQGEGNNSSAPKAPRNRKLIWAGIILAALILAVIGWQYWQYTQSPYYQQMRAVKMIEAQQKESDKWGGKTPEETVRLFTEAVKKGDFELASKYGNRDQIMPVLEKMKAEGRMEAFINDLDMAELKEIPGFDGNNFDLVIYEDNKEYWIMGLYKSDGGTWKIVEF